MSRTRKGIYPPARPLTQREQDLVMSCTNLARKEANKMSEKVSKRLSKKPSPALIMQFGDDLYASAMEQLCIAAQRWNPERHVKFVTYAYHYIRNGIYDAAKHQCDFRLGTFHADRETSDMVAMFSSLENKGRTLANMDHDNNRTFQVWDNLNGESEQDDEDGIFLRELEKKLSTYLNENEVKVFMMRTFDDYTLDEVGTILGVCKERVRQIQYRAKEKLRTNPDFTRMVERMSPRKGLSRQDFHGSRVGIKIA